MKDRFWSKVRKTKNCWEWTGSLTTCGYGQFKIYDRGNGKQLVKRAHQVAWYLEKGEWPSYLCHTCHNRACVNPSHLYEGNHQTNIRDKLKRNLSWSKYNDHLARRIRRVYALGISSTHISKELKVPKKTILDILNGTLCRNTGGPIRDPSQRTYGNRFKNSQTENSRSAARFLISCKKP